MRERRWITVKPANPANPANPGKTKCIHTFHYALRYGVPYQLHIYDGTRTCTRCGTRQEWRER